MIDAPPRDEAAEAAVLGAVMQSPTALTEVAPLLDAEDFYLPRHEYVWDAVCALADAGEGVDPITVGDCMRRAGTLDRAGGQVLLFDLVAAVPTTSNAGYYARIVREKAALRRLLAAGTRIVQAATGTDGAADDVAAVAMAELAAATRPDPTAGSTLIGDTIDALLEELESPPSTEGLVQWPWRNADDVLAPMSPGQLIVVGARASMGKSVCCVDVARHAAIRQGKTVVLHTLEMSRRDIERRILAAEARVPLRAIISHTLTEEHWGRLATARAALADARLHIIDNPDVGLADLRSSVAKEKPDLLVLDYAQLGKVNPKSERRIGLEEYVRGLKLLAKSEDIPVLVAAQLGRGPDLRTDHTPQIADLRETGGLEQDADVVVLLYRPDYYEPECDRSGEIDLIVGKQRNGPKGTVTLVHQLHYSRLMDMAA